MARYSIFTVLMLSFATAALGQGTAASPNKGKQIVDDALAALGGRAFLEMKDRVESGRAYSFYNDELRGLARAKIYTRYLTRPEPTPPNFFGIRERFAMGKDEDVFVLLNEEGSFEITYRGAKPAPQEQYDRDRESRFHNVLYIFRQRLTEPGMTFEFQRTDIFENQPVNIVDIIDSENRVVTVYFHQLTKLPVRQQYIRRDPRTKDRIEEVTVFTKYRDVGGGVQWPFTIRRERNGQKIFEMFAEQVLINQGLVDDIFLVSGNIKILTKKK